MISKYIATALLTTALMTGMASAQTTTTKADATNDSAGTKRCDREAATSRSKTTYLHLCELDPSRTRIAVAADLLTDRVAH